MGKFIEKHNHSGENPEIPPPAAEKTTGKTARPAKKSAGSSFVLRAAMMLEEKPLAELATWPLTATEIFRT